MRKILITEAEKFRILGMHQNVIKKEFLNEQFAGAGNPTDLDITADPTATTPDATTSGATTPEKLGALNNQVVQGPTGDPYQYKASNGKYYYAKKGDKSNNGEPKWVEQTTPKGVAAIQQKILDLAKPQAATNDVVKMETKPLTKIGATTQTSGATTQTLGTTVGGGGSALLGATGVALQQGMQQLQKQFPNIASVDATTQGKIATWSKSPAGQYILNTPTDQREKAMDNLDKMFGGDQLTKELKKPIRQALGMKADNMFGRIGSAVKGGVQGIKQGFNQQM
jgi:hypothetical protein